jgi:hypothetical protein
MTTDHILALLVRERDKFTKAIDALQGPKRKGRPPGPGRKAVLPSVEQDSMPEETVGPTAPVKRKMSAAGRRAIIAATKKRWAAIRAAKAAAAPAPVAARQEAAPAKAPAAKHKTSYAKGAAFRKKMSETIKKAWAARKKKAAAKGKPS